MKTCKTCDITETLKWYSGPLCRQCYRKNLRLEKKKLGFVEKLSKWRLDNKEHCIQKSKEWVLANRDYHLSYQKQYRDAHKIEKQIWEQKDRRVNLSRRIADNLRNRLNISLKKNTKYGSAVRDLGCSIEELKIYLESKFQPGMNWNNWSRMGWHIDHIVPLSAFNLIDEVEQKKACHYTNLQPLWAKDNLCKGSKYE